MLKFCSDFSVNAITWLELDFDLLGRAQWPVGVGSSDQEGPESVHCDLCMQASYHQMDLNFIALIKLMDNAWKEHPIQGRI